MTVHRKHKKSTKKKFVSIVLLIITVIALFFGGIYAYKIYGIIYRPNIHLNKKQFDFLYIKTGSSFNDVVADLIENNYLVDVESFIWVSNKKNYKNHIFPGKYRIKNQMNNNELVNLLRSGNQEPVKLVFNHIKTKEQLAGKLAKQIESDSLSIINLLNNPDTAANYNFDYYNFISMFIPNTYEVYWNTSANELLRRMKKEYEKFWNVERNKKAEESGFSALQINIIASIVEEETNKTDEKPRIAGVYINRFKINMKLESDPTVKFATGNFALRRILKKHLKINSPYNTYKYSGLPPGPICIPSISSIDAVLHYEKHNYLYFCAKDDFSGYHNFASTISGHMKNARNYQIALNKRKIYH